jgi:hypothetical protein
LLLLCSLLAVEELVVLVVAVHLRVVVATRQAVLLLPVYKPQLMVGRSRTFLHRLTPM